MILQGGGSERAFGARAGRRRSCRPNPVAKQIRASLLAATWSAALAELKAQANDATYKTHLRHLKQAHLGEDSGAELIEAPNEVTREWVGRRHLAAVEAALGAQLGRPVTARLVNAPQSATGAAGRKDEPRID